MNNNAVKIGIYVVLTIAALWFGARFYSEFKKRTDISTAVLPGDTSEAAATNVTVAATNAADVASNVVEQSTNQVADTNVVSNTTNTEVADTNVVAQAATN